MAIMLDMDFSIDTLEIGTPGIAGDQVELDMDATQQVTTSDHNKLNNRDLPDQHPMEAITGLDDALGGKVEGDAITNSEIDQLWKSIMG